jgi:hypothetical protein
MCGNCTLYSGRPALSATGPIAPCSQCKQVRQPRGGAPPLGPRKPEVDSIRCAPTSSGAARFSTAEVGDPAASITVPMHSHAHRATIRHGSYLSRLRRWWKRPPPRSTTPDIRAIAALQRSAFHSAGHWKHAGQDEPRRRRHEVGLACQARTKTHVGASGAIAGGETARTAALAHLDIARHGGYRDDPQQDEGLRRERRCRKGSRCLCPGFVGGMRRSWSSAREEESARPRDPRTRPERTSAICLAHAKFLAAKKRVLQ